MKFIMKSTPKTVNIDSKVIEALERKNNNMDNQDVFC